MGEPNYKGWQGSTPPSLLFLYFLHVVPGEMAIPMKPIVAFLLVATQSTGGGGLFSKKKNKSPLTCWPKGFLLEIGSPGKTRTCDQSVNSRPLYQLSYRGTLLFPTFSTRLSQREAS